MEKIKSAGLNIVSIDTNRALEAHPEFQKAVERFKEHQKSLQEKLDNMEESRKPEGRQQVQQELNLIGARLQKEAFNKMKEDVERLAAEKSYDYIFDAGTLLAGGKDVTDELIKNFK